jgi:putative ABC transport system substrate-binding protein
MRRRDFITRIGGAAVAALARPCVADAQPADAMRQIGVLSAAAEGDAEGQARLAAFRQALEKLGWIEGRTVRTVVRWASGDVDRLPALAVELVRLKPDVIFAASGSPLAALQRETRTIPIVFAQAPDPIGGGFVQSLARPGGNITGFSQYEYGIAGKWVELLKQLAPRTARAAMLHDPQNRSSAGYLQAMQAMAPSFGMQLSPVAVRNVSDIDRALGSIAQEPNGGLIVSPGPAISTSRERIIAQAARHRLPAVYPFRYFAAEGGLASYGVDNLDLFRRAAAYVDRVLKGEKPGDLPVQLADKYELVINLKTAKALGLDMPITLLARTDEVIE